jgi:hypothetical protein
MADRSVGDPRSIVPRGTIAVAGIGKQSAKDETRLALDGSMTALGRMMTSRK